MIYIDPRAGSNKLLEKFHEAEREPMTLEGGDIAFFGEGPENALWFIGIEYKKVDDLAACIKTSRFTGEQLPNMMKLFDVSFLLIEGVASMDWATGQMMKRMGKAAYSLGISHQAYTNYLTSIAVHSALAGKPCIIKHTTGIEDTVRVIEATYKWFQKPWEDHKSISRPDLVTKFSKVNYDLELLRTGPGDPDYPKLILRKSLFQLDGIGWAAAGKAADRFGTIEAALAAGEKDWREIEGFGPGRAKLAFKALHGYDDPNVKKRVKRASKE